LWPGPWPGGRPSTPTPDDDGGFADRYVSVNSTFGGAAVIRGDLTPECGAAVQAVLEALGKKAGPEETRTEGQPGNPPVSTLTSEAA
jgi:hypothetical protein